MQLLHEPPPFQRCCKRRSTTAQNLVLRLGNYMPKFVWGDLYSLDKVPGNLAITVHLMAIILSYKHVLPHNITQFFMTSCWPPLYWMRGIVNYYFLKFLVANYHVDACAELEVGARKRGEKTFCFPGKIGI